MKRTNMLAVLLLAALAIFWLSGFGSGGLRTEGIRGSAFLSGEKMTLDSAPAPGDSVSVSDDSDLILADAGGLRLYGEENASFRIDETGLVLESGGLIFVPGASAVEVTAGAGQISASGSVFRAQVFALDGISFTLVESFSGIVQVSVPQTGAHAELVPGWSVLIRSDVPKFVLLDEVDVSAWLSGQMLPFLTGSDGSGTVFLPIPYEKLPYSARGALMAAEEAGFPLPIAHDVLLRFVGTGHSYDQSILSAPLCTEAGLCQYACDLCGETYTVSLEPLGHDPETIPGTPATCSEDGLTDGSVCRRCGEILEEQTVLSSGHVPSENTVISTSYADSSTCYSILLSCERCGVILERENIAHVTDGETRDESETGCYRMVLICTECGMELDSRTIDHDIDETTQLSEDGSTVVITGTCTECGKVIYVTSNAA